MPKQKEAQPAAKETRSAKALVGNPGGNASMGAHYYRVTIPPSWAKAMGLTPKDRALTLSFDGETMIVRRPESTDETID